MGFCDHKIFWQGFSKVILVCCRCEINRDIYSGHSPPPGGGTIFVQFEGGLHEKKEGKRRKKKKVIKHTLKYRNEA